METTGGLCAAERGEQEACVGWSMEMAGGQRLGQRDDGFEQQLF
jgi:hypothetical protein